MLEHNPIYPNLLDYLFEDILKFMLQEIVGCLTNHQNTLVRSLPGMGLNTLITHIADHLRSLPNSYVINIYPHESDYQNYSDLEKLILAKLGIENHSIDNHYKSSSSLVTSLLQTDCRLFVVLNKIQQFQHLQIYLDYFDSLYRSANRHIILLVTADYDVLETFKKIHLLTYFKDYIFPGFISEFNILTTLLESQQEISLTKTQNRKIFLLSLGHTGLIKSLIQQTKINPDLLDNPSQLLSVPDINRRLSEVFQSLINAKVDVSQLFSPQGIAQQQLLGLNYRQQTGQLFYEYYQKCYSFPDVILASLTRTESKIYQTLKDNPGRFITKDELINIISPYNETKSDWSLYKHLNNLHKKLLPYRLQIINKKKLGYSLALTPVSSR
jgi:hypothetical protein